MTTKLTVTGMTCQNCVKHVTEALAALPDVQSVQVSLEGESAVVEHSEDTNIETLIHAVEEEGYEAKEA
ncbi:MAG: hypothetical protein BGO01_15820 [Armatimonadetes bacterium 55-13]|nr:heavy-metal-associated domain-containing protein [Armatimonadota bacterium]ODU53769.1 MAG: hypothetical protein ABT09_01125 [bacterium SCN 57-13]OJU65328.1 MAG: hypothetical protein BGO01_15820 [Armatimonadetes bacterium 55-13]